MSFPPEDAEMDPQEAKITSVLQSIIENDVNTLEKLLLRSDYHITDDFGNSLLQVAILNENTEAFDYLLSQVGFPLEIENSIGETALRLVLKHDFFAQRQQYEYFALQLIKRGARLFPRILYDAICVNFTKVVQLLLDKGLDPNVPVGEERAYLHHLFYPDQDAVELGNLLLAYGADPSYEDELGYSPFEKIMMASPELRQDILPYVIDDHCSLKIRLYTLMQLAFDGYPYFCQILKYVKEVIIDDFRYMAIYIILNCDEIKLEITKDREFLLLIFVLLSSKNIVDFASFPVDTLLSLENLEDFVEDNFNCPFSDFVASINSNLFFKCSLTFSVSESTVSKIVCYLLSYGLTFNQLDFQMVYQKFGYCELFKIMLHIDFDLHYTTYYHNADMNIPVHIMPMFIYLYDLDLTMYLEVPEEFSERCAGVLGMEELLRYFVHPKLARLCEESPREELRVKIKELPTVPLLKQLARDSFRQFLIEKYRIRSAGQFYTCVNNLEVSKVYKKIINYETKLY